MLSVCYSKYCCSREKYGNASGKHQKEERIPLVNEREVFTKKPENYLTSSILEMLLFNEKELIQEVNELWRNQLFILQTFDVR